jgi:hypothetical protein
MIVTSDYLRDHAPPENKTLIFHSGYDDLEYLRRYRRATGDRGNWSRNSNTVPGFRPETSTVGANSWVPFVKITGMRC